MNRHLITTVLLFLIAAIPACTINVDTGLTPATQSSLQPAPPTYPTEAPKPENPVEKGKGFMNGILGEYLNSLSNTEQEVAKKSLDGATMSIVMVTKDGFSYTPEINYVGNHTFNFNMSAIRSKTGLLSFLFYDLTKSQDRARLVDIKITPNGDIAGVDRKTGNVILTIDNAYQMDDNLSPNAVIQVKWNGDSKYQDLKVAVDANGVPLQGELVSAQIAFRNQQSSGDQIALENEANGGAVRGLFSIVNKNRANLALLDPKTEGFYIPSFKGTGLNPLVPAVEKTYEFYLAINSYVTTINSTKKPTETQLTNVEVNNTLQIQRRIDIQGKPFFVASVASSQEIKVNIPVMLAEEKNGVWVWQEANTKNIAQKMGTSFRFSGGNDAAEKKIIMENGTGYTSDWAFHWNNKLRPDIDTFDFSYPDSLVFIYDGKPEVHHLIWGGYNQIPNWLKNGDFNKDQLKEIIQKHVETVAARYKGKVATWSVVNEAFGTGDHNPSFWADRLGKSSDWIELAFQTAHKADPNAKLILNDSGIEFGDQKANQMFDLVQGMKDRGVPIDGVGFQMHLNARDFLSKEKMDTNLRLFIETIEKYKEIGVEVSLTEFDVAMDDISMRPDEEATLQGSIYFNFIKAAKEHGVTNITIFGVRDDNSWLVDFKGHKDVNPLLFDKDGKKKLSYYFVMAALLEP